jgi:hypothetical protein
MSSFAIDGGDLVIGASRTMATVKPSIIIKAIDSTVWEVFASEALNESRGRFSRIEPTQYDAG